MNLHDIASSVIQTINPLQDITITSKGSYTVDQYGKATSVAGSSITVKADVQPVNSEDIKFITNYNQSTIYKAFWVSSNVFGINRPLAKGGDIITWNGKTYYVVSMNEDWYETSGWNHFIGALQLGNSNGY